MKKILLSVLCCLVFAAANAQFTPIAEGPVFKEPEEGFAKIIQMKSGYTLFFHIAFKDGIDVQVYDATHKQVATTSLKPAYGKLKYGAVQGVFEIGGNAVLMISEVSSSIPTLYRLVVDGKTGELKEEVAVGVLNKITFGSGYAMAFGGVPMPTFYVRKDPNSDNYAVALFNSFESDRSKRIEIIAYGANNQEISRAYYASPDEKYKYLEYIDMAVIGGDKVCVLAYGHNKGKDGDRALILANLDKGAKTVNFTELGFSQDLRVYAGITRYNPATKSLILIANTKENDKDKGYSPIMAMVNPYEKKINRVNAVGPSDRINEYSSNKEGFRGLPENMFINDDGTFTVVYEEETVVTSSGSNYSTVSTLLGDLAVVTYSKTGEFMEDHIIRKSQGLGQTDLPLFYHSQREGGAQQLIKGNQFKSFAYVYGNAKSYILFNDTERNNDKQESGKLVTVTGVSASDGFYYPLKVLDIVPKRDYIFGNPEKKKDHNLALFSISDYDKTRNIYTTLKLENEGGKKGVKVVWMQP